MSRYTAFIKKTLKNKVIHYVLSSYATYFIQFVNSIFIAVFLGPYYLGIWGFITLIIKYLSHFNMGIAHSVNAIIAIKKDRQTYVEKVIGTSLTMLLILSFIVILFFSANELFQLKIGSKYNFSTYAPVVALIGILGYFNSLFSSVFRVYGRIIEIAINQSVYPVLVLMVIFLFKGENLIWALVVANLLAFFLSLGLYIIRSPVKIKPLFICKFIKIIQIKGWYLFVYNTSFYLIVISTQSFVSAYYSVEEFGQFTFAFSLANVVLLLLQSFSFLIYPKLLNRMASASNEKVVELLNMVRDVYITTSHLLVHFAILFIPIFLLFFPQYNQSANAFKLIALTVVLYTNSFGYSGLLIAKNTEKKLSSLSLSALLINIINAFIFIEIFHVSFELVIVATMLTYFIYVLLLSRMGRKSLQLDTSVRSVLKDIYPIRLCGPYLLSLVFIICTVDKIYFTIPLMLFVLLNYKILINYRKMGFKILANPDLVNI